MPDVISHLYQNLFILRQRANKRQEYERRFSMSAATRLAHHAAHASEIIIADASERATATRASILRRRAENLHNDSSRGSHGSRRHEDALTGDRLPREQNLRHS